MRILPKDSQFLQKKTGTYAPNYMDTHHIPNRQYFYDFFSFVKKLLSTKCDHILHAKSQDNSIKHFFYIRTVHRDIIKVLFICQLIR